MHTNTDICICPIKKILRLYNFAFRHGQPQCVSWPSVVGWVQRARRRMMERQWPSRPQRRLRRGWSQRGKGVLGRGWYDRERGRCGDGFSNKLSRSIKSVQSNNSKTYRGLLNDDVFDGEVLNVNVFSISVGFGVLKKTSDEFDRFLGPATCPSYEISLSTWIDHYAPCVALNSLAWLALPTPPANRLKGITRLCSLTSPRYA